MKIFSQPACASRSPGFLAALAVFIAMLTFTDILPAAGAPPPRVFGIPPSALAASKARLATNDAALKPAFDALLAEADKASRRKLVSVMDKPKAPASGDKHDYSSTAPYFWPDPTKPDGLPYIRRDGQRNPESGNEHSDSPRLSRTASAASTLALAYYLGGREEYAAHAARTLRVWFLDPATRMNPNFNHAQAVPGVNTGRGTGMVESRSLTSVCDAAGLLAGSTNWTAADQEGLVRWMGEFLDWALTSKLGREERAAKNNHGTHYDAQVAHYALFCGRTNLAREILASARTNRLAAQIQPDGSQPLELARADSFAYSCFNLGAMFDLATLGEHVGVDLWQYRGPTGAGIRAALDFLLPYVEHPDQPWPHERGRKQSRTISPALLRQAHAVYRDPRCLELLRRLPGAEAGRDVLLFNLP